jgi:hypothetical protein
LDNNVADRIEKVPNKKEIMASFKPVETIKHKMRFVKDNLDHHKGKGVYKVECSCGKFYFRETNHSFQIIIKEHGADIKNERTHTSTLVEHSFTSKHHVFLEDTKIIAKEDHLFRGGRCGGGYCMDPVDTKFLITIGI